MATQEQLLKTAFLVGAVTDALALVPMLLPPMAKVMWGLDTTSGATRFSMGYGASLMFGWTLLLAWASRKPMERRSVAALTVVVVWGLVLTEVAGVASGILAVGRMAPTWFLQAGLLALFAAGYHHSTILEFTTPGRTSSSTRSSP